MALSPRGGTVLNDVDQMDRFKTYVRSLNEQFARWVVQQWETKADKFWSHGMVDYLRHAVIIKRDHPDAAAAVGAPPPTSAWGHARRRLHATHLCGTSSTGTNLNHTS